MDMFAAIAARSDAVDVGVAPLIRARLDEARRLALRGDRERARQLCAGAVLEWQPWICRDAELLQTAIATLFHARGFEQLRRLLAAAQGRRVRFVPIPPDAPPPQTQGIAATGLRDGTIVFQFADGLFDHPSRERLVEAWSWQQVAPPPPVASA
jgi:hypothetical protein